MNRRAADIFLAVVLALITLTLYRKITRLWWTYDDAFLIHIAADHPASDHFVAPSLWRSMPQRLFTPLLTASFDAELSQFGVNAIDFYRVQLALVMLLSIAVFFLGRMWLSPLASAAAAFLFITGPPICGLATQLMLMHYMESIILSAVSIVLFVMALRRRSTAGSIVSAAFYLAAMLAKEIAVPLLIVVLFLPERRFSERMRTATPHALALVVYLAWRWMCLGALVGGYGWVIRKEDLPRLITSVPIAVAGHLSGASAWIGGGLLLVIAAGIAFRIRSPRDAVLIAGLLILSIAPTLPLAKKVESRFTIVMWLCCSLIAVAGFMTISDTRVRSSLLIVAALLAIIVNRQTWQREYSSARRMSDEARVFFNLGAGDALRMPAVPPAAMGELQWLKEAYLRRPPGAAWFYDDIFLCTSRALPRRVFTWSEPRREAVEIPGIASFRDRYCQSIRTDAPLSASFQHRGDSLFWNLGPYDVGTYAVVMGDGVQAFEIPRNDGFRLPGVTALSLRVRYRSPEQWVTYSPELRLDFSRRSDCAWQR